MEQPSKADHAVGIAALKRLIDAARTQFDASAKEAEGHYERFKKADSEGRRSEAQINSLQVSLEALLRVHDAPPLDPGSSQC